MESVLMSRVMYSVGHISLVEAAQRVRGCVNMLEGREPESKRYFEPIKVTKVDDDYWEAVAVAQLPEADLSPELNPFKEFLLNSSPEPLTPRFDEDHPSIGINPVPTDIPLTVTTERLADALVKIHTWIPDGTKWEPEGTKARLLRIRARSTYGSWARAAVQAFLPVDRFLKEDGGLFARIRIVLWERE